ncbi:hypothetical protein ACVNP3_09945 [Pseudomonas chlororaphis subsp. piscium]
MSILTAENIPEKKLAKPKHTWIAHDDLYDGDFLRGWHFAVHRVHTSALGYSLIPHNKAGVPGYNYQVNEDSFSLSCRSLIFNTPLATSDWTAALKTELKAIQISRASKGKEGYVIATLYQLNDAKTGLRTERILETTQSAVIAYLRQGTEFPLSSENKESV